MAKAIPVSNSLKRFAARLFQDSDQQTKFIASLTEPADLPVAVVWTRDRPDSLPFSPLPSPSWYPANVDLVAFEERPGRHRLHEAGAYYCLDPSSVFMAQAIPELSDCDSVLDLCAAPGGKCILAWTKLRPRCLIANEVIGKRVGVLVANLRRCGIVPVTVTGVDPSVYSRDASCSADIVIVDAPCSGQSLIARGKTSPGCFHPATINMNSNRQRRILAHAADVVKPGGWLAYMTCTYARKENERNVEWFLKKHPEFTAVVRDDMAAYQSSLTDVPCYRLWPGQGEGAGGFMATFRRESAPQQDSSGTFRRIPVRWKAQEETDAPESA